MHKSRLQELCQRRRWELPVYQFRKEGSDHVPRFQATVIVQDCSFSTHSFFNSSKEAQNDAAKVAIDYLSGSQRPSLSYPPLSTSTSTPDRVNESIGEISDDHGAQLLIPRENDESKSARVDSAFKNLLQELAHRKGYQLPTYVTVVNGEVHLPTFLSTVKVGGQCFTGQEAKTKKQAELSAAKVAYTTLQQRPSSIEMNSSPTTDGELQEANRTPSRNQIAVNDDSSRELRHTYKNQLQIYAAKRNLGLPLYSWERMGPPHACSFKCKVVVDGKTYESQEFYPTLAKAEHAAAKVALMSLSPDNVEEDESIYKNLLQDLVQKYRYPLPIYNTKKSGELHSPVFFSTVEVKGQIFRGLEARTKKQAEMSAAKIAYTSLRQCEKSSQSPKMLPSTVQQEATLQIATSLCHPDLVSYLDRNFQLQLPEANERVSNGIGNNGELIASSGMELNSTTTRASTSSASSVHLLGQHLSLSSFPCEVDSAVVKPSNTEGVVVANNSHLTKIVVHPQRMQMLYPPDITVLPAGNEEWAAVNIPPQLNLNQ
ncbi:hypothetical protein K2173_026824 [Erythroxylum novogranatense]|uniref:DRBM domain-containing protein n=1 Tax=Erythroxylum novogranatense TaxID=1862640 RepID=A0AAV8TXJ4_9ROSI|nr:hypothetical protein K2173_026824 [Erythroxylum novogranatense]